MTVRLASLVVGGTAGAWHALGFDVDDRGVLAFGNTAVELEAEAIGMVALRIDGRAGLPADVDGVGLLAGTCPVDNAGADHPNGCFEIDHVVILTPSIERTSAAIESVLGLPQRRVRETATVRQAFHRFDGRGCIVELVESARAERAMLWGLVVNTVDLDAFVERCGSDLVGAPKPAVQPGRRIVTVRPAAGLGVALAVMSVNQPHG